MKINGIEQQTSLLGPPKKGLKTERKDLDFQRCLNEAKSNRPAAPCAGSETTPLPELSAATKLDELRREGITVAENTLRLLEDYQTAIGNPRVPLREIDTIVRSLSQEVKSLDGLSGKMPSTDPLVKILGDMEIVSRVEIEKFNRGEYI